MPSGSHVPGSAAKARMLRDSTEGVDPSGAQLPRALLAAWKGGRCSVRPEKGVEP